MDEVNAVSSRTVVMGYLDLHCVPVLQMDDDQAVARASPVGAAIQSNHATQSEGAPQALP